MPTQKIISGVERWAATAKIEYEDDNTGHAARRWDHWYRTLNHWSLLLDTGHGGGDGAHALLLPVQLIHPHQHAASL